MTQKKYKIYTYGCQMNKSDSERIAAVLERAGYRLAKSEKQADLIVVNACSVRQSAVDRIYGKTRAFAKLKIKNEKLKIILTGCVLPKDKEKLKDKFDLFLDIKNIPQLLKYLHFNTSVYGSENGKEGGENYFDIKPKYNTRFCAYVPIMTGCNNFCSYCAVPYVRGREVSRNVADVLAEIKALAKRGCREITLLGQNVNAYRPSDVKSFLKDNPYAKKNPPQSPFSKGGSEGGFAALLWEVNQIPGIERVHFTAPHPADMSDEVIDALTLPKMVNYLHLPVQSGDDEVLRRMNRNYTAADYVKLVEKIKKKKPGIVLGTDIIVGFPGETKKAFQNTVKLYKKIGFDIAYLAMYSPRQGTAAAKLKDDVPQAEKKRRWDTLQNLMEKITLKKNKKYVGKVVSVLVDEYRDISPHPNPLPQGERGQGWCIGNSLEMKRVRFLVNPPFNPLLKKGDKGRFIGKIFDVRIKKAFEWILEGEAK